MNEPTPATHQVRLLTRLKRLRVDRNESLRAVGDALDWSEAKMSRIETGAVRLSVSDLRVLADHYQVGEAERTELVELVRGSRQHAWWDDYRPFYSPDYIRFVGLESSAQRVREFQLLRIPGLLQTPDYTAAMVTAPDPGIDDEYVKREQEVRARRQIRLREGKARFEFVLDEAVLHRRVCGEHAWRRQLNHLAETADLGNVTIRVFPFTAGLARGMGNSFELFDLTAADQPDAVLVEQLERDILLVGNDARTASFAMAFDQLWAAALSPAESQRRIRDALKNSA